MTILIPAYEPDKRLLTLIDQLQSISSMPIVIVDDGSGPAYDELFRQAEWRGCTILTHPVNHGKGRALKTGFDYIFVRGEREGVVTADCDGQHTPEDILKIADAVRTSSGCLILGSRRFTGKVPLRSRFGNTVTRSVFRFVTGVPVSDTQTGLRGFPVDTIPFARRVPGDRFEYEMNLLLQAPENGLPIKEVEIETVYAAKGHTSHFRTIQDSARVYRPILKFGLSASVSAAIDLIALLILQYATDNLLLSVIMARLLSATCNFLLNQMYVFKSRNRSTASHSLEKYAVLATIILGMNYLLLHFMSEVGGVPLVLAKILTETALYVFSYWAQRKFVFAKPTTA